MLTTEDNPYNPFNEFENWYSWDTTNGYHTLEYLSRVLGWSDEVSEADQESIYLETLNEILDLNLSGNYKIIEKEMI